MTDQQGKPASEKTVYTDAQKTEYYHKMAVENEAKQTAIKEALVKAILEQKDPKKMKEVAKVTEKFTETLYALFNRGTDQQKNQHQSSIRNQIEAFIKEESKTKTLPENIIRAIKNQSMFLQKAKPENFVKVRTGCAEYVGKLDKELGERFKNAITSPVVLAEVKQEKQAEKASAAKTAKAKTAKKEKSKDKEIERD